MNDFNVRHQPRNNNNNTWSYGNLLTLINVKSHTRSRHSLNVSQGILDEIVQKRAVNGRPTWATVSWTTGHASYHLHCPHTAVLALFTLFWGIKVQGLLTARPNAFSGGGISYYRAPSCPEIPDIPEILKLSCNQKLSWNFSHLVRMSWYWLLLCCSYGIAFILYLVTS